MSSTVYSAFKEQPLVPAPERPPLRPPVLAKVIDTALSGLGLWAAFVSLSWAESSTTVKLFHPAMLASSIIFFAGPTPPNPKGFVMGSVCAVTLCFTTLEILSAMMPPIAAQGAVSAVLLMWYKSFGVMFPPVAALAGSIVVPLSAVAPDTFVGVMRFLLFPWLSGHAWVFAVSFAVAELRSRVRIALAQQRMQSSLQAHSEDELRAIFDKFETSGDGALDASELKVALRVALGFELDLGECEQLVRLADTDGTGTVEFDEFVAICKNQL